MANFTHVPYVDGNLQDWVGVKQHEQFGFTGKGCEWRENTSFYAKMTYVGYSRGQSSTKFTWMDEGGNFYPMFVTDLDAVLVDGLISFSQEGGPVAILGTWIVTKRGQNYGIKLVTE